MNNLIKEWVLLGGECLNLWMESGIEQPGDKARVMMKTWINQCCDAGWSEVSDLGNKLLDDTMGIEQKADLFLQLCVWYESIRGHVGILFLKDTYE